jgi:uncharacterized membrane protein YdbT with pleckstrin-like domain
MGSFLRLSLLAFSSRLTEFQIVAPEHPFNESAIYAIERPSPRLMHYYALCCLMTGPLFPILIVPNFFKYHTLRYRFDAEGVSMRWGILFRREVILNYARIQDIHLTSNLIERWLGLARVQIQTASGNANAEMTVEGLHEFEMIRDFLYSKMRGLKESRGPAAASVTTPNASMEQAAPNGASLAEVTATLKEAAAELRALRSAVEQRNASERPSKDA